MTATAVTHASVAKLKPRERVVLRVLAEAGGDDRLARLSRREIAAKAGMHVGEGLEPSHLSRVLRELEEAGVITVEGRDPEAGYVNAIRLADDYRPVTGWAQIYDGLSLQDAWVYNGITNRTYGPSQGDWPASHELAAEIGVSVWTLRKAVERLVEGGYLEIVRGDLPYPVAYRQTSVLPRKVVE